MSFSKIRPISNTDFRLHRSVHFIREIKKGKNCTVIKKHVPNIKTPLGRKSYNKCDFLVKVETFNPTCLFRVLSDCIWRDVDCSHLSC